MTYWKGNDCIAIMTDPNHKRKGLYVGNRYCIKRVATFASDDDADGFDKYLCGFLGLRWEDAGRDEQITPDKQNIDDMADS